ncbi:hypothetical protein [Azospirillum sp.]|uniref:hypothetical protein n=1 Tax=Azospirillum sp. TaxID=34012 RepID=UPI003D70C5B3
MSDVIETIRRGDLYALLSVCSDDDLEPLVTRIADAVPTFLEADEDYRNHRPQHSRYHRLIGDALRHCGDSPAVGAARGEGPSYDDLVVEVCKKLDVPYEVGQTAKNERNVLTIHLGQELTALSPEEREAILAQAREEASGKASTLATTAREGVSSLLSHAVDLRQKVAALSLDEQAAVVGTVREVSDKAASVVTAAKERANSLFSRAARLGEKLTASRSGEQATVVAKAQEVASKAASVASIAREEATSFLSRAVFRPLEESASGFTLAEPLFKVTVPCVLHLAYLRRKHLDRLSAAGCAAPLAALPASEWSAEAATPGADVTVHGPGLPVPAASTSSVPSDIRSAPLIIGASADKPVLSLARIPEPSDQAWNPVAVSGDGISRLNPLLQAVPALGTALQVSTTNYMEVVVNGPLAEAIGGGFRGWVRGAEGKIVEQARLFEAANLSNVVSAGALFQIASVAVAQKHLADISHKLSEIKASVDRIQRFLTDERRSVLTGALRYFEQIAPSVLAGELSDSIRNQIEHHEAHLLPIQEHLLKDIRHETREILDVKGSDTFGTKGTQDAIKAHQKQLEELYRQLLLCIRARACGWQLLVVFPGEERLKENRKRSIQEALGRLDESGDLLKETDRFVREKVKGLSSFWNTTATLNERKLTLLAWNEALVGEVAFCKEQIGLDIRAAEAVATERLQPVRMLLKIEGERIVGICAA